MQPIRLRTGELFKNRRKFNLFIMQIGEQSESLDGRNFLLTTYAIAKNPKALPPFVESYRSLGWIQEGATQFDEDISNCFLAMYETHSLYPLKIEQKLPFPMAILENKKPCPLQDAEELEAIFNNLVRYNKGLLLRLKSNAIRQDDLKAIVELGLVFEGTEEIEPVVFDFLEANVQINGDKVKVIRPKVMEVKSKL